MTQFDGEEFCFNCEGSDLRNLDEVFPPWLFVEPEPNSFIADDTNGVTNLAQIGQSAEKVCPPRWNLAAISLREVMCTPSWVVTFDPVRGCPGNQVFRGIGCCLEEAWFDFVPDDEEPEQDCPPEWEFDEDLGKCIPFWVTSPPTPLCDGTIQCVEGFSLQDDTCWLDDFEEFMWLMINPDTLGLFGNPPTECPEGWFFNNDLNSCMFERSSPLGTIYWFLWDP